VGRDREKIDDYALLFHDNSVMGGDPFSFFILINYDFDSIFQE
jgi:hypothetical protein